MTDDKHNIDVETAMAMVAAGHSKWSTPDEYWEIFLKRNNKSSITRISQSYPIEHVIIIDLKKVFDNKIERSVREDRMGKTIEDIELAAKRLLMERTPDVQHNYPLLRIRFDHVSHLVPISELRIKDIDKLIAIRCLVKRVSEVRPKIIRATFQCNNGHFTEVPGHFNNVPIPRNCDVQGCRSTHMTHSRGRDIMVNRQFIYIQEPLDELKGGSQPSTLKVEVIDEQCNTVMVGDRLTINGAYRAIDRNKGDRLDSTKEVYFECNNAEVGIRDYEEVIITEEDEKTIREIASKGNVFAAIEQSIAPSIKGMALLKQAIALMLFEGVTKTMPDGTVVRGQVNVLCISDPGMAKTVLLRFVVSITPRGVFANATTATKVGLIAPVVKDELTGMWAIEAGAYMLANGGVLCLDEIGELSKEDFKALHEAMENGEVHITKAGINATVKTSASMLAASNPIKGRFSAYESLPSQVQIPAGVLSRFDLVVLLQDMPGKTSDRAIAQFITDAHMTMGQRMAGKEVNKDLADLLRPEIEPDVLRKYIAFARKINPVITPEANKMLVDYYVSIRPFTETGQTVAVTTRQQPSVIRLAEAHARIRLSEFVEEEDAAMAIKVFDNALRCVATDPSTGKLDIDRVQNVSNAQSRSLTDAILRAIGTIGGDFSTAHETAIIEALTHQGFDAVKVHRRLDELGREGKLMQPKNGLWKVM